MLLFNIILDEENKEKGENEEKLKHKKEFAKKYK